MAHILDKGQMLERSGVNDNICPIEEFHSKWVGGAVATPPRYDTG